MSVTERDEEILGWVGRFRFATVAQIGKRFEMKVPKVYRRLDVWRGVGIACHRRPYRETAGVVWVTPAGARLLGLGEVRNPALEMISVKHEVAVVDEAIDVELAGRTTISEREMRRELSAGTDWSVRLPSGRSRWPDLTETGFNGSRSRAIEVEFAAKRSSRLRDILAGYGRSKSYAEVEFVCEKGAVAERLSKLATEIDSTWGGPRCPHLSLSPWRQSRESARILAASDQLRGVVLATRGSNGQPDATVQTLFGD